MAPRANWKGFLRLSLVTCPVALYPATSDFEKISFNQINRNTGHRIKYMKVDADTGEEVSNEDIMKGYKIDTDTYIEVSKDELEHIALDSTRTIDIDEFVPKSDIDPRYLIRPYYLVPDGKVGHDAFAVIRETIRSMDMVAIGRLVLTSREHIIGLEPRDLPSGDFENQIRRLGVETSQQKGPPTESQWPEILVINLLSRQWGMSAESGRCLLEPKHVCLDLSFPLLKRHRPLWCSPSIWGYVMPTELRSPRLAVLIDADNASAKIVDGLFEEIARERNFSGCTHQESTLTEAPCDPASRSLAKIHSRTALA